MEDARDVRPRPPHWPPLRVDEVPGQPDTRGFSRNPTRDARDPPGRPVTGRVQPMNQPGSLKEAASRWGRNASLPRRNSLPQSTFKGRPDEVYFAP